MSIVCVVCTHCIRCLSKYLLCLPCMSTLMHAGRVCSAHDLLTLRGITQTMHTKLRYHAYHHTHNYIFTSIQIIPCLPYTTIHHHTPPYTTIHTNISWNRLSHVIWQEIPRCYCSLQSLHLLYGTRGWTRGINPDLELRCLWVIR